MGLRDLRHLRDMRGWGFSVSSSVGVGKSEVRGGPLSPQPRADAHDSGTEAAFERARVMLMELAPGRFLGGLGSCCFLGSF